MTNKLPAGVLPKGSSPTFTSDSLPDALRNEHTLAAGRWGALQILRGSVTFIDIGSGKELDVTAPGLVIIAPKQPHKLRLKDGELSCRIDFFQEPNGHDHPRTKHVAQGEAVRASFARCEATGDFAEKFYEVFLATSEEIGAFFANTDFSKQRKLLRASVYMLVTRDVTDEKARELIERVGQSHSRDELNIAPGLYEDWLDSLCKTAGELDPEWSDELEAAWRARMRDGMQIITAAW